MSSSHIVTITDSLLHLRQEFVSKREIIVESIDQFEVHRKRWDNFFSENTLISRALSYAKSNKQSRIQKLRDFDASFQELFVESVDLLLRSSCQDWTSLARLQHDIQNCRALNVADPIWTNFLRCFQALAIFEAEPSEISSCRELIGRIRRWQPDEKFIVGESRLGLHLYSCSTSNEADVLQGNFLLI